MYLLRSALVVAVMAIAFLSPFSAHAAALPFFEGPIVPCGNNVTVGPWVDETGRQFMCTAGECNTCGLVTLAKNLIDIAIFLAVIVATLMFMYAGVLYLFSAANPGNISRAHKIFWDVLLGLVLILAAWMVVDVLMKVLYGDGPQGWGPWNQILCGEASTAPDCRPIEASRAGAPGAPSLEASAP